MALKRKNYEPVVCDIVMKQKTPVSANLKLTLEFLKFVMYQKGQIPVPYPQLKSYTCVVEQEVAKFDDEKSSLVNLKPKERFALAQLHRKRQKFLKAARKFESDFNAVTEAVSSAFESNCQQVAIVIGTSVFNPQEIYTLDWSHIKNLTSSKSVDSQEALRREKVNQASLFRYLVTCDDLMPLLSPVRACSLHVICQTHEAPKGALPRVHFKFPSRTRCATLRMLSNEEAVSSGGDSLSTPEKLDALATAMQQKPLITDLDSHRPVMRRLAFDSPCHRVQRSLRSVDDCDISGIASLDDDDDQDEDDCFSSNSEEPSDYQLCWFQIKTSLQGFPDHCMFR